MTAKRIFYDKWQNPAFPCKLDGHSRSLFAIVKGINLFQK